MARIHGESALIAGPWATPLGQRLDGAHISCPSSSSHASVTPPPESQPLAVMLVEHDESASSHTP